MNTLERILLLIIILMSLWIIYRDFIEEQHMVRIMEQQAQITEVINRHIVDTPQVVQDAIYNELIVKDYEETDNQ